MSCSGRPCSRRGQCTDPVEVYTAPIAKFRPNVVVVWIGDQEVYDRVERKSLVKVGSREWSDALRGFLDQARTVAFHHGATLVVATLPCAFTGRDPHRLGIRAQDAAARVEAFNETVRGLHHETSMWPLPMLRRTFARPANP